MKRVQRIGVSGMPASNGWTCLRLIASVLMLMCAHVHLTTGASAQTTGVIRIACEAPGWSYVLDGANRMSDREVTLLEGPHRFVFWAPERRMLDTTYMVLSNTTRELRISLRYSPEFIAHRQEAERFQRNDRWVRYGTPVVVLGTAAWAGVSIKRAIDARKDLDALESEYYASSYPAGISDLKENRIPDANRELRASRTMAFVSSGVFVASAVGTWYLRNRFARKGEPIFDDKEKARFEGLAWVPVDGSTGCWMAALSIPLR